MDESDIVDKRDKKFKYKPPQTYCGHHLEQDAVTEIVKGLFWANQSRRFSRRAIHKVFYLACAENQNLRNYLGWSLSDLLIHSNPRPYGPLLDTVDNAVSHLLKEGYLGQEKIQVRYSDARVYFLVQDAQSEPPSLPISLDELKIPSYIPTEQRIFRAKKHFFNGLIQRNFSWVKAPNLYLAYSFLRETYVNPRLLSETETATLIDKMNTLDRLFSLPFPTWQRSFGKEPQFFSLERFKESIEEVLEIESPTGNERNVADTIASLASSSGLHAEVDVHNNLYVIHRGKHPEKIMLIFHLDTVEGFPKPRIHDGVIYGRGAVDNKGPCLAGLFSMIMLCQNHITPDFSVVLLGASSEETPDRSQRGIIKAIEERRTLFSTSVLAIVGEATGEMKDSLSSLNYSLGERARWTGDILVGCRVGDVETGIHVAHVQDEVTWIQNMEQKTLLYWIKLPDIRGLSRRALTEIKEIERELPETELGKTTIDVWDTWAPSSRNQTPCRGMMHFDIRLAHDGHRTIIKERILQILRKWFLPPFYFGENWNENCGKVLRYTETEAGYEIRRIERELAPFFEALQMRRTNYSFGTDAKHILELTKTPVIGIGSGEEHYAHRTDEQVRIFELLNASLVYFSVIQACRCDKNSGRPRIILPNRSRLRDYIS